jgi:solute carrier family 44 (choline transporter-like protein), member 2/4/5
MSEKAKVHAEGKEDNTTRPEDLEKLEGGPIEDRGCTDILCCLLFIAAQVGWAYLLYRGITEGSPGKLIAVYDENSEMCGYGD